MADNNSLPLIADKIWFDNIADAIRAKTGKTEKMSFDEIETELDSLITEEETMNATANAEDIVEGKTAYVKGELITGTMPIVEIATPSIEFNEDSGLITATVTQNETGYTNGGTKTATMQLAFQPAVTITPSNVDQIVASKGTYVGGNITVKGDSNLTAENIKSGINIFGVNGSFIGEKGENNLDSLIDRTIISYTNNKVTTIGKYGFYGCSKLKTVNLPVCTTIGNHAFNNCKSLSTANFPTCTTIDDYAFYICTSLQTISFPICTVISGFAFHSCYALQTIDFPMCTTIGNNAFGYCRNLSTVSFPMCTTIDNDAFFSCTTLRSISFPMCTTIGSDAFCYCRNLSKIYLMNSMICRLSNTRAFSYTSIWSDKGSIFVPTSLVNSYKTATNWTFFSNRIFGV